MGWRIKVNTEGCKFNDKDRTGPWVWHIKKKKWSFDVWKYISPNSIEIEVIRGSNKKDYIGMCVYKAKYNIFGQGHNLLILKALKLKFFFFSF